MRVASVVAAVLFAVAAPASAALVCCPFCEAPSLTLAEQLGQSDVSVLVQWVEAQSPDKDKGFAGSTTYEVVEVVRDVAQAYPAGTKVVLDRERAGQPGDLFILLGTKGANVEWASPLSVSETSYQYIKQAPSKETPVAERLKYYTRFLEYQDPMVSADAYSEFANAPYKDIAPIKDDFPRDDLRRWLTDANTPKTRLGLYGLMLGLCGTPEDAQLLRGLIEEPTQEYRLGIDGIMAGYLLLTGEEGLALIEETKLRNSDAVFSETYAGMSSLRFLWTYAPERIPAERLRQSMRILLDRPDLADLVITDLARWEDWSIVDRLFQMYGQEEYGIPSIKRNIVRYFLVAERAKGPSESDPQPQSAVRAHEYLAKIKETDPKTYEAAKRFFILN
ncbi:MAG: hypothetical protein JNG89_20930 [Planctomycetaceae bacterium]|nr:hypothetical protein [Planctomycetaceae bacterium]